MGAGAVEQLPCFKDLISVLIECFLIIGLGYLSVSLKLVSPQARDINSYLTNLALPMIIFLNIAKMELNKINMSFLICMLLGKLIVFISVTTLTLLTSYPRNFGYAGILAILSTQSNDFALGYPLIKSLYNDPQKKMLSYLSLMAPIQLLFLNPVAVVMMEYNKTQLLKKSKSNPRFSQKNCKCFQHQSSHRASIEATATEAKTVASDKGLVVELATDNHRQQSSSNLESSGWNNRFASLKLIKRKSLSTINMTSNDAHSAYSGESSLESQSSSPNRKKLVFDVGGESGHFESFASPTSSVRTIDRNLNTSLATDAGIADNQAGRPLTCNCKCVMSSKSKASLSFLIALATNPIIVASLTALLINQTYGSTLPKFVTKVANTIAASFAAPAMFVVGVSLYGKFQVLLKNPVDLLLSIVLVLTKEILLSNLFRLITLLILPHYMKGDELNQLVDFSFLYGLLPNAPNASVLANQYGLLTNVVSTCMLLSTLFSAPLMFVAALIINKASILQDTLGLQSLSSLTKFLSSLILSLSLMVFYSVLRVARTRRFDPECPPIRSIEEERVEEARMSHHTIEGTKNPARVFLILLVMCQAMVGIGGVTRFFMDSGQAVITNTLPNLPVVIPQILASQNYSTSREQAFITNPPTESEASLRANGLFSHLFAINSINHNSPLEINQKSANYSQVWLNKLQYSFSSYGIVMARIIVIGFALTLVVAEKKGPELGRAFAGRLLKLHHLIAVTLALSLFFISKVSYQDKITDATLPDNTSSLYARLAINLLFICTVLPALVWMLRRNNKERLKLLEDISYIKRNFLTSNNSTPSESSSAVTLNTCLESTSVNNTGSNQVLEINNNQAPQDDPLLIALESSCSDQKFSERPTPDSELKTYPIADITSNKNPVSAACEPADVDDVQTFGNRLLGDFGSSLNRHSILLVIMLFNSCYNLTTVAQKLIQPDTFGTFRQIEMTNIILELSQGIWTFLIYRGVTGLFD